MNPLADVEAVLRARDAQLADLGELAGPLTHEFNNFLNNLTLHLEIMKLSAPASLVADIDRLRRQLTQTAAHITRFQRYRRAGGGAEATADLNTMVQQAAEMATQLTSDPMSGLPLVVRLAQPDALAAEGVTLTVLLQEGLTPVRGHPADVRRLSRFLLNNAVRAAANRGNRVQVWTRRHENATQLVVEDNGAEVPREALPRIFEPGQECREGMCCLELAACRSIVRRLNGRIEPQSLSTGGLSITVTFPD